MSEGARKLLSVEPRLLGHNRRTMASSAVWALRGSPLLLALIACAPRVSATLEFNDASAPSKREPAKPPPAAKLQPFDLTRALDGVEHSLLALDALRSGPDQHQAYDADAMRSWLPTEGLRSLYYYASMRGLSLGVLAGLFDAAVFVGGPHVEQANFDAQSFGRYNPEFVRRVGVAAHALGEDRARVERTRPAFEGSLQRQALTYLLVFKAIHRDPAWYADFKRSYAASIGQRDSTFTLHNQLNPMCEAFETRGMTWYEANTAAYFWVRRDLDGTASLWFEAVEALLGAYGVATDGEPPGFPASAG